MMKIISILLLNQNVGKSQIVKESKDSCIINISLSKIKNTLQKLSSLQMTARHAASQAACAIAVLMTYPTQYNGVEFD